MCADLRAQGDNGDGGGVKSRTVSDTDMLLHPGELKSFDFPFLSYTERMVEVCGKCRCFRWWGGGGGGGDGVPLSSPTIVYCHAIFCFLLALLRLLLLYHCSATVCNSSWVCILTGLLSSPVEGISSTTPSCECDIFEVFDCLGRFSSV